MWETLISWYINKYLGDYVEDLNSQQLSLALGQGELELENVPLKKNVFRFWGVPIEVKSSVVGRIKIEFNLLKYFRNEPVLITIENVYLVAVPLNLAKWDPIQEADLDRQIKMNALDSHEARWKTQFELTSNASSNYSSLYFSSMQIGASIVTKVIENLQLMVRNVHIRFEEVVDQTLVAFGVTLKSLTAQSCDAQWNPLSSSPTGNTPDCSFKTLQLTEFVIYCDTKAEKFSDLYPVDLINTMNKISRTEDILLCPVSAEARISKNNSSHPISNSAKRSFDVQLTLDKVPLQLQLSDALLRTTFSSYKAYCGLHRNCRFRRYRPFNVSVKEAPVLWWKYAVRAILVCKGYYTHRTVLKTYEKMCERAINNIEFVNAYEQHLRQEELPEDLIILKEQMETELDYDDIVALREIAMRRVERSGQPSITKDSISKLDLQTGSNKSSLTEPDLVSIMSSTCYRAFSYLLPSWSNWVYTANPSAVEHTASVTREVSDDKIIQLRKIESELDESIMEDMKSYGKDVVLARFRFVLKRGRIKLIRSSGPFLTMDFFDANISTELYPKSGVHKFHTSLASLSLRHCPTKSLLVLPHSSISVPSVKGQLNGLSALKEPIFRLVYERRPQRISLTTRPLDLVIYPFIWKELSSFFSFYEVEAPLFVSRKHPMPDKISRKLKTRKIAKSVNDICVIEVKCATLRICLIDDCRDSNVPLAQVTLSGLDVQRNIMKYAASAKSTISVDYYNRELCRWERILKPWKFYLNLIQNERSIRDQSSQFPLKAPQFDLTISSCQVMNINFTSTLLALYKMFSRSSSTECGHRDKRRIPAVPLILKNETGSILWFCAIISNQDDVSKQRLGKLSSDGTSWIQVGNGGSQTFSFQERENLRHRNMHKQKVHQLIVLMNGWCESRPISVDSVGTYFRDIIPISKPFGKEMGDLPTMRLAFEVSLQGSTQKIVRIRSALLFPAKGRLLEKCRSLRRKGKVSKLEIGDTCQKTVNENRSSRTMQRTHLG